MQHQTGLNAASKGNIVAKFFKGKDIFSLYGSYNHHDKGGFLCSSCRYAGGENDSESEDATLLCRDHEKPAIQDWLQVRGDLQEISVVPPQGAQV